MAMTVAASVNYKLLFALLILSILLKGGCSQRCSLLSSIEVQQRTIGTMAGLDTTFEVEVKNKCHCMVTQVFLSSPGFASSARVDPELFREAGRDGYYLVNGGKGIRTFASVKFTYSWDHYFKMTPKSFKVKCK